MAFAVFLVPCVDLGYAFISLRPVSVALEGPEGRRRVIPIERTRQNPSG